MDGNKRVLRLVALLFALLFIAAAIVQYNDPDPFIWIMFYGIAAVACLLFFANRFPPALGFILAAIYLVSAIRVWPEQFEGVSIGSGDIENIERGREALGLLIMALVMLFLGWRSRSKNP